MNSNKGVTERWALNYTHLTELLEEKEISHNLAPRH